MAQAVLERPATADTQDPSRAVTQPLHPDAAAQRLHDQGAYGTLQALANREGSRPTEILVAARPDMQAALLFADQGFIVQPDQIAARLALPADKMWDWDTFQQISRQDKKRLVAEGKAIADPQEWKQKMQAYFDGVRDRGMDHQYAPVMQALGIEGTSDAEFQLLLDEYVTSPNGMEKFYEKIKTLPSTESLYGIAKLSKMLFGEVASKDIVSQIVLLHGRLQTDDSPTHSAIAAELSHASMQQTDETRKTIQDLQGLRADAVTVRKADHQEDTWVPDETKWQASQETTSSGEASSLSDIGEGRATQQDFTAIKESDLPAGVKRVAVLTDGHGSDTAAGIAYEEFMDAFTDAMTQNSSSVEDAIRQAVAAADNAINSGGTTFTAAIELADRTVIVSVGDSRAYTQSPDGSLKQITKDHNWPNDERKYGLMLSRALGDKDSKRASHGEITAEPDIISVPKSAGNTIMLCSDGLTGYASDAQIAEAMKGKSPAEATRALIALAKANPNLGDNVSAIVLKQ